ncbi:MAG: STT3 domain-containing protein [Campylobacterota bacterium]|nr:STT3 domain-containing protein [Campylobacterota bacterium]
MFNGEFLLLSPDGYAYAEGARDILSGTQHNTLSRVTAPLSILTALLVKILPFSIDTIIFYMSTFLSSLIVIPVFFITKRFGSNYLAFGAAIFSSVVVAYYRRTMSGYYDTDMLIIVLPMFIYWFLIEALVNKNRLFASFAVMATLLFAWWLPSNIALNLSIAIMVALYTLLFDRKSLFNYFVFILILIAALPVALLVKVTALMLVFIFLYFHNRLNVKITLYVFTIIIVLSIVGILIYNVTVFDLILQKVLYYFAKGTDYDNGLYFTDSGSYVIEVSSIGYFNFATRVSGNIFILPIAVLGYVFMTIRYRIMILFLPMLLLGAMSYGVPGLIPSAGLRFSFYATPVLAISLMYAIVWLSAVSKKFFHKNIKLRYILFVLVLLPNINHVLKFQPKTIFENSDVKTLDNLHKSISKNDYVVSWWDYGYYLRYYSEVKTVCDGGRQLGKILYPVSYIFMSQSQSVSANLSQLLTHEVNKNSSLNYMNMMMKTFDYKDPNLFLNDLSKNKIIPKKDNFDTYIYIPKVMIENYGTIDQFSQTNLKTGELVQNSKYFHLSKEPVVFKNKNIIPLGDGIVYMKDKHELYFKNHNRSGKIKKILTISYDISGNIGVRTENTYNREGYTMIKMHDGRVIIANDDVLNSTLIQMGVLQNYNHELFEAIELSEDAKVYRVKKESDF